MSVMSFVLYDTYMRRNQEKNLYALTGNRTRVSCLVGTHSATKPLVLTYNRYIKRSQSDFKQWRRRKRKRRRKRRGTTTTRERRRKRKKERTKGCWLFLTTISIYFKIFNYIFFLHCTIFHFLNFIHDVSFTHATYKWMFFVRVM